MTFMDAVKELRAGKCVTRKSWSICQLLWSSDVWGFVNCSYEGYPEDYFEAWTPKLVDFLADDWISTVPAMANAGSELKRIEFTLDELVNRVATLEARGVA